MKIKIRYQCEDGEAMFRARCNIDISTDGVAEVKWSFAPEISDDTRAPCMVEIMEAVVAGIRGPSQEPPQ